MGAPTPVFIPQAFATSAGPSFRNTIPDTSIDTQRATWTNGFPPVTMAPKISGGKPPLGQDVNGVLYMLSTHTYAAQAGQLPLWSSAVAAAISGYALGTVLGSTDGSTVWFNISAGNTTDPDDTATAVGWVPLKSYGMAAITGLVGGSRTLTTAEAARPVIVLTGTLVANQAIILPTWLNSWLIVNATSGGFTTTVRTASGTGVTVPQGGFSEPVEVYGDGTNIYPTVAPLTIPSDVAPTPDTYAVRSNAGYLYATYFNMSGAVDNTAIVNCFYDAGDGFLRRMTQANFRAQLFNNAALTGVPTAPTASAGTSTTQIATTAFVGNAKSAAVQVAANGTLLGGTAGYTSSRSAVGRYTITHNRGAANYGVSLVAINTTTPYRFQWAATPEANAVQVYCYSSTDSAYVDAAFSLTLVPY